MPPLADRNPRPKIAPPGAERLAAQLSSMLPGAAVIEIRIQGPRTLWPHLDLTAFTEHGRALPVSRAKSLPIARWIIRSFPQAGWAASGGHAFDLRTAQLCGLEG
ncbi:transcriptional regulator [Streptomyces xiamenensis]